MIHAGSSKAAGGQGAHAGHRLQRKAEIGAAAPAERDLQPAARFIRDVPIAADLSARHIDLIVVEHDLGAEGRAGPRWHHVQWQIVTRDGSPVAVKRTAPHMQPPA